MKTYSRNFIIGFVALYALLLCSVSAQSQVQDVAEDAEFPQEGVLSVAGNVPAAGTLSLPLPPGLAPGKTPPITGGLSQKGGTDWGYQVTNNFTKRVSVNLEIRQYDVTRKNILTTRVSHRLNSGESTSANFSSRKETIGCALVLTSWKFVK